MGAGGYIKVPCLRVHIRKGSWSTTKNKVHLSNFVHPRIVNAMKSVIAIALFISCLCVLASAQDTVNCLQQASSLASCVTRLSESGGDDFCNECGNPLFRYYRDCIGSTSAVTQGESYYIKQTDNFAVRTIIISDKNTSSIVDGN